MNTITADYTLYYWLFGILIYLIGYALAYLQHRKNDIELDYKDRTNGDMVIGIILSLFSWIWFILAIIAYWSNKGSIKEWFNKKAKW